MVDQYSKFIRVARTIPWRGPVPSLNYIVTSSGWRQEHNGFSHQNPAFIDDMLNREGGFVNVYFPPDGNSALVAVRHMLSSTNEINLLVAGKTVEPRWLTTEEAEQQFSEGIMVWKFASDPNPDLVFSAAGSYLTLEALAALSIVKRELPKVRLRFVSIMSLSPIGFDKSGEQRLSQEEFDQLYTPDAPIVVNFHGYPQSIKQILFDYTDARRFSVHGYQERGSTTTPFDIHIRNGTSRYDLAIDAVQRLAERTIISSAEAERLVNKYRQRTDQTVTYVKEHGIDPPWITNWQWPGNQDEF